MGMMKQIWMEMQENELENNEYENIWLEKNNIKPISFNETEKYKILLKNYKKKLNNLKY